jgi:hypothetical protein
MVVGWARKSKRGVGGLILKNNKKGGAIPRAAFSFPSKGNLLVSYR